MCPWQSRHPIAQDGSIAPLEEDAQPAPQVGSCFPFLLPSMPCKGCAQLLHLPLCTWASESMQNLLNCIAAFPNILMLLLALYCTYCAPSQFLHTLHSSQVMLWGHQRAERLPCFSGSLFSVFWLHSREECQFSLHVYNNEISLILIFTSAYALIFIHRRFGSLFLLMGVLIGSLLHKKNGSILGP